MTQAGDNADPIRGNGKMASGTPIPISERASVEVRPKATRRQFSAGYRRRIVEEAELLTPAERGALLRREGLDSSYLAHWKSEMNRSETEAAEAAEAGENGPRRRGPKPDPKQAEVRQLERENARLAAKLKQAELIIDAQKKLAEIFGAASPATSPDRSDAGR